MQSIKRAKNKLLHSKGIFMYVRSSIAAQLASWIDMGVSFALFAWVGLYPWLSTAIGAVAGGVINCVINYKFTFHASDCSIKAVAVKYSMVWTGSLTLNTIGTALLYMLLGGWDWLQDMGFNSDGCFAAARLTTSLVVSIFWNYLLQKNFVYVRGKLDSRLELLLDTAAETILFRRQKHNTKQKQS